MRHPISLTCLGAALLAAGCGGDSGRREVTRPHELPALRGRVTVPPSDRTPPVAVLVLREGTRAIRSVSPVRDDDEPPVLLTGPVVELTAVIGDPEGTGRIRASLVYRRDCPGRAPRRWTHHFPPSEIAAVRLPPGAEAPVRRRRRATVRLESGPAGCVVRGSAWADATNAAGLESFSDQIHFVLRG